MDCVSLGKLVGIIYFATWTLMLYAIHRLAHQLSWLSKYHQDHHKQVAQNTNLGFHWTNLLLIVDNRDSTIDQWLTEVIPTVVFCAVTGHWWIFVFYYVWAAFIQERIEHNNTVNWYPWLTSGRWHLVHHKHPRSNYGVFTPAWDILFRTAHYD